MEKTILRASANPFVTFRYEGPEYFCDREKETAELLGALKNGRNVTFIAQRRMGKTGVIHHLFHRLHETEPDIVCIYCDIFNSKDKRSFAEIFGASVMTSLKSQSEKLFTKLLEVLGSLRPVMSFDPLTSLPTFSLSVEEKRSEQTIQSILEFIKNSGKICYVAIDEFQQISNYKDINMEALLRSYIQFIPNAQFIFSGSSRHIMSEMFLSANRPFFSSTQILNLGPISKDTYFAFADKFFKAKGGSISREVFDWIYDAVEGCTQYMQVMLNRLYEKYDTVSDIDAAKQALRAMVEEFSNLYQAMVTPLTEKQFLLLKAIAAEGMVQQPNGGEFLSKYALGAASSINAALKALISKDLVQRQREGYSVCDNMLQYWLKYINK